MQTLITGVKLHVHHIPALELNVAGIPFLATAIALKDKAALGGPNIYLHSLAHRFLLH